ncbi:hypothetical protein [Streptomyces adonidis]|uniref:Secreted protein n=1 Tax=Streptomyces sp. NBC_00093 TaxID=2975649 RepID=A0AAU1ZRM5_9ACTN
MSGNTGGMRGSWAILLGAGLLLAGCSAPARGTGTEADASSRGTGPSASAGSSVDSPAVSSPSGRASASGSSSDSSATSVFTPAASLVPRTAKDGGLLAESVVLAPADLGRDFGAQDPAESTPGTWAVLDESCRWEREKLPRGVLASTSRYSRQPAAAGKSAIKVTAVATVHTDALGADEQVSTTLEEVLRCPEQRPRSNERITDLMSLGTPFGAREQEYADDSVLEAGRFTENGGAAQSYRWMVARLGTVVVAVSVTGGTGHTDQELNELGSKALAQMLTRVEQRLKEK